MELRKVLVVLILASTVLFGVAVAFERSNADEHAPSTEANHSGETGEETHSEAGGTTEAPTETASGESEAADEGTIFGINPETLPIVVLVVVASLALAGALWLHADWRWLLVIAAIGMSAFAILDVREAINQFNEDNTGLGLAAVLVAMLHAGAAVVALLLLRQSAEVMMNHGSEAER